MTSKRNLVLGDQALDDLRYWTAKKPKTAQKILKLIEVILRSPFAGEGKPEPLKHLKPNTWSRRINQEHRLIYEVSDHQILVVQCRYHY